MQAVTGSDFAIFRVSLRPQVTGSDSEKKTWSPKDDQE